MPGHKTVQAQVGAIPSVTQAERQRLLDTRTGTVYEDRRFLGR
jgi:hypothetical protein